MTGARRRSPPDTDKIASLRLRELLLAFVSLGMGCEMGLLQRYCGAEPLDLFRFALTPLDGLIQQLDAGLAAFTRSATLTVRADSTWREFYVKETTSGISLHTDRLVSDCSIHDVLRQELRRVPRLARKLVQELKAGERIFVYCQEEMREEDSLGLHAALTHHGPARLLVVTTAAQASDIGCVVKAGDGLMLGYLDQVCPPGWARYPSLDVWLAVLRTAERVARNDAVPAGVPVPARAEDYDVPASVNGCHLWRALAARRRQEGSLAAALFARHRNDFPEPDALGQEFDAEFQAAAE